MLSHTFSMGSELSNPSPKIPIFADPCASHITMLVSMTNTPNDVPKGILFGLPPEIFGQHRCNCLALLRHLHSLIPAFLSNAPQNNLPRDWCSFQSHMGLCQAPLNPVDRKRQPAKVCFLCAADDAAWNAFFTAISAASLFQILVAKPMSP